MRTRWITLAGAALALTLASTAQALWLWDLDENHIDDRIQDVITRGIPAAHVMEDPARPAIIVVHPEDAPLTFGVYVKYDHMPADADVVALQATGATLTWRPRYIPYLRARANYAQVQALAASPGVSRVEAVQVMHPVNDNASRTLRARDAAGGIGQGMFPSVWTNLGITGKGVVIGILDTGVNDAPDGVNYPGHESLRGKFLGGGDFSNESASLNTPTDSSANPMNRVDPEGSYHGTHVAGTAMGTGGPEGIRAGAAPGAYAGMAPDARLVDCKVLTDAGEGSGAAAALEWCVAHKDTYWNPANPDADYRGIQVINMSIGGASASDGTDADCAAVNAAVRAGITVCVATGNDGKTRYLPSPAAADQDVAVGAFQDANSLQHGDDIVADYSNEGPRADDGDTDHFDEMKPSVLGSGSDIVSALGDPGTDGRRYHNINGTSMATPTIAGLCALIRQANPNLSPLEVRTVLQNTAEHRRDHGKQPPASADTFNLDPNYHPSWGWGEPDAYAAVKEALDPYTTQVVQEGVSSTGVVSGHLQVGVQWTTQREVDVTRFNVWRAPERNGAAGGFSVASPAVLPAGHSVMERTLNRTRYVWTDTDPSLVAGNAYWYQVRWTDTQGREHTEPAFRVTTSTVVVRARISWAISHNALDNDILTVFGTGVSTASPFLVRPTGGSTSADSAKTIVPIGFGGPTKEYFFHADLTDLDHARSYLPPSAANPWFLSVLEKGYINTEGIVDSFSVTVFDGSGSQTYRSVQPTTPTVEGQTTVFWIPSNPALALNHSPVFDPVGDRSVGEGLNLNFAVHAVDPDGQALTYAASGLPLGASFNATTRTFSWNPGFGQAGSYDVAFTATDPSLAADSERVTITVTHRTAGSNTAPGLDPISDASVHVESFLSFKVTATDAEGGPLIYSTSALQGSSGFNPSTQTFSWLPHSGEEGTYPVTFRVTDNQGAADSQTVLITVTPGSAHLPPQSSCVPDTSLLTGTVGVNVQGLNDVSSSNSFTVPANTGAIHGSLAWLGGPAIDLDFLLLDSNGNTVGGSASLNDPEVITVTDPAPGTYTWKVVSYNNPNPSEAYTITSTKCTRTATAVGTGGRVSYALHPNTPNPFGRSTTLRFALPRTGQVSLKVYDVTGRLARTLVDGPLQSGMHQRVWDGRRDDGSTVSSGVYFYRLDSRDGSLSRRMILLR